ncbi:MAG: hypothetical protein MMC33_002574 [Icmadophila ericetorum]|nr:hypothetical protein [Icmadophila ericetorum]
MGSFLFKWYGWTQTYTSYEPSHSSMRAMRDLCNYETRLDHPANEVFVTGTFDDWSKSVKLDKKEGTLHEKMVELPSATEKIYYKFVVDGNWIADHTAPIEYDNSENINNVLLPSQITKPGSTEPSTGHAPADLMAAAASTGLMAGVVPHSTTAQLAGDVPKESAKDLGRTASSDLPGSFPETPAAEPSEYSVNPIPATTGPGNPVQLEPNEKVPDPSALTTNTIASTVKDDPELMTSEKDAMKKEEPEQTFGVAPLPATTGVGNPIQLEPGEKVPHPSDFTNNNINSMVTLDKESYEKGSSATPVLPAVVTPEAERDAKGGMFGLPPISNNMIPESSLPMGNGTTAMEKDPGAVIQSSGPNTTTAALAGGVPIEPRGVPEVVSESQEEAGFAPEASANPEAVVEKTAVEKELESKVPEEAPTSEGMGTNAATEAASANHEGGLTGGEIAALVAGGTVATAGAGAAAVGAMTSKAEISGTAIAPIVPDVVQKSIAEAHQTPEAAASTTMVEEKSAMESQLLKRVKTEEAGGEPAPTETAALSEIAPTATGILKTETPAIGTGTSMMTTAETPAMTPAAKNVVAQAVDSRDISPMSKTPTAAQTQPIVTTGVGSTTTTPTSTPMKSEKSKMESPAMSTPTSSKNGESSSTPTDKKSKRKSGFFMKIKEKFSHHDKK